MANGSGAGFDGDGSVRWEVVTVDDDPRKAETLPYGEMKVGRKNTGADKVHGQYFKIDLLVPQTWRNEFLAQFTGTPVKKGGGEVIELYLPIEKTRNQIEVHWSQGIAPPPVTRSRSV
jgi:hypothetical protein